MSTDIKKIRLPTAVKVVLLMVVFVGIMFLFINEFNLPIHLALFTS
ncbi:MAG: hypothetical protein QM500_08240 [Methylococcales bacterium]